jgi:hypothetical protein
MVRKSEERVIPVACRLETLLHFTFPGPAATLPPADTPLAPERKSLGRRHSHTTPEMVIY